MVDCHGTAKGNGKGRFFVRDNLEDVGEAENTIVIFTTDNGAEV
jgi:hypothetical protein